MISFTFPSLFLPLMGLDEEIIAFTAELSPEHIAPLIDHTILHAVTTEQDVHRIISEARAYNFAAVCIPARFVAYAADHLHGSGVGLATVVNFPLANETTAAVCVATADAIHNGATEIDMVVNPSLVGTPLYAAQIRAVAQTVLDNVGDMLKVIIEAGYLTPEGVRSATQAIVSVAQAYPTLRFMTKTSTGMAQDAYLVVKYDGTKKTGARREDLAIIADVHLASGLGNLAIKASGGVRSFDDAVVALYAMGARSVVNLSSNHYRLGTSSGVSIVKGIS